MADTTHEYRHAIILVQGRRMAESESGTISLKGGTIRKKTAGHYGVLRPSNPVSDATMTMRFMVPVGGPDFDFLQALRRGDLLGITVDDDLFGGEYDMTVDDISGDDEVNGEKSYSVSLGGWKKV